MSFHGRDFSSRLGYMGDSAEETCDRWMRLNGGTTEHLGWDRPRMGVSRMGQRLRHLPDLYASDGHLYECVGVGRDDLVKGVKVEKWESLKFWNGVQPLRLWVWSSTRRQGAMIPWPSLVTLIARARRRGIESFHDGNEYYPIEWEWLEPFVVYEDER